MADDPTAPPPASSAASAAPADGAAQTPGDFNRLRDGAPVEVTPAAGPPQIVAVTGATGFVGRHIVATLLKAGHRVRALARDPAKAARALPGERDHGGRLEIVTGEILDGRAPHALVAGCDTAIHLIGIIREARGGQTFDRLHLEATREIIHAAERAGVGRYLHMSALGVRPDHPAEYARSKFAAERLVRASELAWTVFRPGLILGDGGEFMQMMQRWAQGRAQPFLFMPYFKRFDTDLSGRRPSFGLKTPRVQPVRVEDVAATFVGAIDQPAAVGEIYNLVGPEVLPFDEMLRRVRDKTPQAKRTIRAVGVPGSAAVAQATVLGWLGLGELLPFDPGMAIMGQADATASDTKAAQELGFHPAAAI